MERREYSLTGEEDLQSRRSRSIRSSNARAERAVIYFWLSSSLAGGIITSCVTILIGSARSYRRLGLFIWEYYDRQNMEINTIRDAFERLTMKQKLCRSMTREGIEAFRQETQSSIERLQCGHESHCKAVPAELKNTLKSISLFAQLEARYRKLTASLRKYAKLLEKSFNPDISKAYRNVDPDIDTISQIIGSHLYREGLLRLVEDHLWFHLLVHFHLMVELHNSLDSQGDFYAPRSSVIINKNKCRRSISVGPIVYHWRRLHANASLKNGFSKI
ncbi:hypothetical protein SAY87_017148 [Trapa incisa]|uniref:Uncharacterized protein n=1 Tax=Trapa incisa TaxID=236973 RepID=A0AAN7LJ50_9MYRT|nr:hypothetical protein SAY87_017148 [Trapa incisa]